MLELNMNGKMLSDNDIVVLISKDSIQNMTEVKFFTDDGEVALDDITATIDIKINIIAHAVMAARYRSPTLIIGHPYTLLVTVVPFFIAILEIGICAAIAITTAISDINTTGVL